MGKILFLVMMNLITYKLTLKKIKLKLHNIRQKITLPKFLIRELDRVMSLITNEIITIWCLQKRDLDWWDQD